MTVKGPLPGHEMSDLVSRPTTQTTHAPQKRTPFMVGAMGALSFVCLVGAGITAGQLWPSITGMAYAAWMLAGAAMFAAIATGLHLLHRIATAVERRS
jgi:hypothetical protein